jgi:hypothetical protein
MEFWRTTGSIANKDAEVIIKPSIGTTLTSRNMFIYTEGSLHEIIHHAGRNKYYIDTELARAAASLPLSDASKEYLKIKDITKNPGASDFWDHTLQVHCPGLVEKNGALKTLPIN